MQPMQPIIKDEKGGARFKENAIVRLLLDECDKRGFGLSDLTVRDFTQADWEQFFQLIGYPLVGYHELSCVSDATARAATRRARRVVPGASGCRDKGCPIHIGVRREKP